MRDGRPEIPTRPGRWHAPGVEIDDCLEPETIEDLGSILANASKEKTALLIIGGATRLGWANRACGIEIGVSTLGLKGVDVFEPDEGVLHARAGTRISDIRRIAREAGWEFPIDPPGASSTLGGVIASAATGPRAQRFGRVADAILGLEVVAADGTATKCGGRVVKNVTGYDLAKLYCGSFGTLGIIVGAWLRLHPAPMRTMAIRMPLPRGRESFEACRRLAKRTSIRALSWVEGEAADDIEGVYLELGGSDAEVEHDLAGIESEHRVESIAVDRIDAIRDARASLRDASVVFRARVLGVDCASLIDRMRALELAVSADLGLGVVHARGRVDSRDVLLGIREATVARGGFTTFETLPDEWRAGLDVFGAAVANDEIAASIKSRFDPHGILNPGRVQTGH